MTLSRTNIALTLLGLVAAAAVTYFMFIYLAPAESVLPPRRAFSSELKTEVLSDARYKALREPVSLVAPPPKPGWPNPFQSLEERDQF